MRETQELRAEPRSGTGKGPAYQIRQKGHVPAMIYGGEAAPENVSVDIARWSVMSAPARSSPRLFMLEVDGKKTRVISARAAARSGQRPPGACRFHAAGRRRQDAHRHSRALQGPGKFARPQARRRAQHRAPRGRADLPGRQHSRLHRGRSVRPRHPRFDAHLGLQAARRRQAGHQRPRLHRRLDRCADPRHRRAEGRCRRRGRRRSRPGGRRRRRPPKAPRPVRRPPPALPRACSRRRACCRCQGAGRRKPSPPAGAKAPEKKLRRGATAVGASSPCRTHRFSSPGWAIPARNMRATATMRASWRWTRSTRATISGPGAPSYQGLIAEGKLARRKTYLLKPMTYMNDSGIVGRRRRCGS